MTNESADPTDGERAAGAETIADTDHESSGEGVTRAYERKTEARDETV